MRIQKSVQYLALLILSVAVSSLFFTIQNAQRDDSTFLQVNHTHEVIEQTDDVNTEVLDMESAVRGFVISGNPAFIEGLATTKRKLEQEIDNLRKLTADNPVQQQNVLLLTQLAFKKLQFQDQVLKYYALSRDSALQAISSLRGKDLSDSIKSVTALMESEEKKLLDTRIATNRNLASKRFFYSIFVAIASFLVLLLALVKINKEIKLRKTAESDSRANEMKYRGLIENSAVVIFSTDLKGFFTYVSNKCLDLTGYTADELIGVHYSILINEDWKETVEAFYIRQFRDSLFETQLRFPIVTKEGFEKWVEQNIVLYKIDDSPVGFQSIVKDITETKLGEDLLQAAELQLKAQQEENQFRLQAILDNIPMIVYIKDLEGRFVLINKQFKEVFGVTDEMALGKFAHDISRNKAAALRFAAADQQVIRTLKPLEVEDISMTRNGERNMLITKFPLFDQNNQLFAIGGIDKDISAMVRDREQLIAAKLRAEQAERLQEEFLANMSHEIRTPMNGVIGMTNLLVETTLTDEQREFVHLIRHSSDTLHVLINDILDLSKIKAGRMTVEEVDFNLYEVVDAALASMKPAAKEKGIELVKQIDNRLPLYVSGDKYKLSQVLNNLITNAVKFTEKGEIVLTAELETNTTAGLALRFSVADTGIGIGTEHLETIFDNFVQAGNDVVRRFGGTGLGLSITKKLIELQGGQIAVESEKGKGSTFSFVITYRQTAQPSYVKGVTTEQLTEQSLKGKRILLVEDNLVNQKVTYHLLEKAGLLVDIADDGRYAIKMLEEGKEYDLVIMDLQMQDMDGFQTTLYIRQKLGLQLPIIAMTASALRNERAKCFEIGMNEYLTKPFVPKELFHLLLRYLTPSGETLTLETKQSSGKPSDQKLYDLSYVKEMEDPEYTMEILQLFLDTTPVALEEIRDAALHEKWEEAYQAAHKLKSSIGVLQMNTILTLVTTIEHSAKEQQELEAIPGILKEIGRQMNLIKPMLLAELAEAKAQLC